MHSILQYVLILGGVIVSAFCLNLFFVLARANRTESSKSAARSRTLMDAFRGRARVYDDWLPDSRVQGGLIFNRRKKRIEISGRLSDDSLDRAFR